MPIYERGKGRFRVIAFANKKQHERIVRGPRRLALAHEAKLRHEIGAKEKLTVDAEIEDTDEIVWIGGHSGSFVYFIQSGDRGAIKIGYSRRAGVRLSQLQAGSPVRLYLLCAIPGGPALERCLHSGLRRHRIRGEWFRPHAEVTGLAAELANGMRREER
jgi:hypothetical protein